MASSASSGEGEIERKTVEETTKESFLEKIQTNFGDEVMKAFESKSWFYFSLHCKYTS